MRILTGYYFSGTGNTRYITEYLCGKLKGTYDIQLFDVTEAGDFAGAIKKSEIVLFAFPVYGSAPPIPMRNFVHRCGELLRGKKVILVETQYFFSGDGPATIGRTVKKYGGRIIGAEIFNMPNNLADCKVFPIKNGEEIQRTLARARKRADRFSKHLLKGNAPKRGFSVLSHAVGYYSQRKFWAKGESAKRKKLKISQEKCVGCGLCVKKCPVKNLFLENKHAKPLGKCVLCYRCVNLCPKQAISLIGANPPEKQYLGPK